MTVAELYKELHQRIPAELSCEWDNDGLLCCPDGQREARRALITLDVTAEAVDLALRDGYDLILSHHPMIFKGLRAVNGENYIADKVIRLIRGGVSVMSFHTRLDAVRGGVNDCLALLLGLENAIPFGEEGIGRIGALPRETTAEDFAAKVKETLGAPYVNLGDAKRPVQQVAVLGGGGSDDVEAAYAAGADTYVTGELKYHQLCDAPEAGMNLIEAGHFYTEFPVTGVLANLLQEIDSSIEFTIFNGNTVKTI